MVHVGLIGVGLMGHGIARNILAKGGFPLAFLDHPGNRPVDDLLAQGARACASAAEVAANSDVVILCVTGSPQVESILTGEDGPLSRMRRGTIVVDCSTAIPDSTLRMAAAVRDAGGEFLDAPMTGTAKHAEEGRLNLLIGGEAELIGTVRPVLDSFAGNVTHVGPLGSGHRLKLLHNYVSLGFMALLAEAAAHAADTGVDPSVFVEILANGGGGGAAMQRMAPFIMTGDPSNVPFFVSNALKDLDYYVTMADNAKASKTIADSIRETLAGIVAQGHGQAYIPELTRFLRRSEPG